MPRPIYTDGAFAFKIKINIYKRKESKMKETLQRIRENALNAISDPNSDIEQIRIQYLGKKGELTSVLRGMGALSSEERPIVGQMANEVRSAIEEALTLSSSGEHLH